MGSIRLRKKFFFWSPLVRRHLFWPPSMVYISIIITHILHIINQARWHIFPWLDRSVHVCLLIAKMVLSIGEKYETLSIYPCLAVVHFASLLFRYIFHFYSELKILSLAGIRTRVFRYEADSIPMCYCASVDVEKSNWLSIQSDSIQVKIIVKNLYILLLCTHFCIVYSMF